MSDKGKGSYKDELYDERFENMSYEEFREAIEEDRGTKEGQRTDKDKNIKKKKRYGIRLIAVMLTFVLIFQGIAVLFDTFRIDAIDFLKTSYELSKDETVQEWKQSVVVIQGEGPFGRSKGTGFIISSDGLLLTNHHVIENQKTVGVSTEDGEIYNGELIGSDEEKDLALLNINGENHPFLRLREKRAGESAHIFVIGNPLSFTKIANEGHILGEERTNEEALGISAPIYRGNSGSPVITESGEVTGVVYAKKTIQESNQESIGLAVPIEDVHTFLHEHLPER